MDTADFVYAAVKGIYIWRIYAKELNYWILRL